MLQRLMTRQHSFSNVKTITCEFLFLYNEGSTYVFINMNNSCNNNYNEAK